MFFVDVDSLKQINDTQGHQTGDRALTSIANALRDIAPSDGIAGRIGGDEFCLLQTAGPTDRTLDETDIQKAIAAAAPGLTATVGRADATPTDDLARLVARADHQMYSRRARRET